MSSYFVRFHTRIRAVRPFHTKNSFLSANIPIRKINPFAAYLRIYGELNTFPGGNDLKIVTICGHGRLATDHNLHAFVYVMRVNKQAEFFEKMPHNLSLVQLRISY